MSFGIRPLEPTDWPQVQRIYAEGIATGYATFETAPPESWEAFDGVRVRDHRFVALREGRVVGWAAAAAVSTRPVYRGVLEHSVYVADGARGQGVGHVLLDAVIASTEAAGVWTIQSSVFADNHASLALHARHGSDREA